METKENDITKDPVTVEVIEEVPKKELTEADLRAAGLDEKEITSAKETGFITEEKKEEPKEPEEKKPEPEKKEEEEEEKPVDVSVEDDPEKENALLSKYNRNEQALYWENKKNLRKRQAAQADRDHIELEKKLLEKRNQELEEQLKTVREKPAVAEPTLEEELLEDGTPKPVVDPKKKPLTIEDLERIEKEKNEKAQKETEVLKERGAKVSAALDVFNDDGRARYSDFDKTIDLTTKLVDKAVRGQLGDVYKDPRTVSKVERKVREFLWMVGNADKIGENTYNPADLGYEIGQLHPDYDKKSDSNARESNGNGKQDGTLSPDKLRRIEENATRRVSSAALGGGSSRRPVSVEDLTPEEAAALPREQWNKLPPHVRKRILQSV